VVHVHRERDRLRDIVVVRQQAVPDARLPQREAFVCPRFQLVSGRFMFSSVFSTVTGLLDRRFVLGLLLPVLAFWAGVGALAATAYGWSQVNSWWQHLDTSRHVALVLVTVAGLVFMAIVIGTQVVPMTRVLEGYWSWSWADRTIGRLGRYRQAKRRT